MALKPCRECKKKVSTEASTCPNCGVPNPTIKKKKVRKEIEPTFQYKFGKVEIGTEKKSRSEYVTPKASNKIKTNDYSLTTFLDGDMELGPAFWLYGMLGSIVIGVITGFLSAASHPGWGVLYIIGLAIILVCLWRTASNYNELKKKNNEPSTWGIVVKVVVVISAIGLGNFAIDLMRLLGELPPI